VVREGAEAVSRHRHDLRHLIHLANCHAVIDVAHCAACGLSLVRRHETGVFLMPDRCERCAELAEGAEPHPPTIEAVE
jgi:ribosomal protein L37AE/L43A